jgi:hypothetical protein
MGRRDVEPLPARAPDARYVRFEHPSEAGIPIIERSVKRIPGKICSEDEHQIAVEAFRDA